MADHHFEPFVHLAGLTHDDALIAWGGFWFHDPDEDGSGWGIVEDPDLSEVAEPDRRASFGAASRPYGAARVEVVEDDTGRVAATASSSEVNHVWVRGLEPDMLYRYRVTVDGQPWAEGSRSDWLAGTGAPDLVDSGRVYDNRFRTFPAPDTVAPLRFAVLGDYGVGILSTEHGHRQRRLAAALERAVNAWGVRLLVTTGDNVYVGREDTVAGTGNHDDDWYYSFYEPYRYLINRIPVYPGVGNHDTGESELSDNRDQLADNLYTDLRFATEAEVGRASLDPGLYYQFSYGADVEFLCIDTTEASALEHRYFFEHPRHRGFLEEALPERTDADAPPRWRIPFSHHPPFCAGPHHHNFQPLIDRVVPLLERAGVRAMFSGHEHNFQHQRVGGVDYVVSGAGGKLREEAPDGFAEAHTRSWAAEGHFLLVEIDEDEMRVHPVTDVADDGGLTYVAAQSPSGEPVDFPIRVRSHG